MQIYFNFMHTSLVADLTTAHDNLGMWNRIYRNSETGQGFEDIKRIPLENLVMTLCNCIL